MFGDMIPAGYSFHQAAGIYIKGGAVGILLRGSFKCESHLRFQAKSVEKIISTEFCTLWISVCVVISYQLNPKMV